MTIPGIVAAQLLGLSVSGNIGLASGIGAAIGIAHTTAAAVGAATGTGAAAAVVGSLPDPTFSNVVLLVGFDGADASTTFTDESPVARTLTTVGNAQVDTASVKFGTGAGLFDGTGDRITAPDSDDWLLSGEFNIAVWVRPNFSSTDTGGIVTQWSNISGGNNFHLHYFFSSSTAKRFAFVMDPEGDATSPFELLPSLTNIDQSVFHFVMVDRDASNTVRLSVDGVMVDSGTLVGGANVSGLLRIGDRGDSAMPFNGWIDELRIVKGQSLWGSDAAFNVPTAAFARS